MLNLTQVQSQIKSTPAPRPNPANLTGLNECYRRLKAAGWVCRGGEMHPADRVPVFRLGCVALRRDKNTPGDWIVEVGESIIHMSGLDAVIARGNSWGGDLVSEMRRRELEAELESLRDELRHTLEGASRNACKRAITLVEAELGEAACDECQAGRCCGRCWCCYDRREIPFMGEPVTTEEWADDYGLGAIA